MKTKIICILVFTLLIASAVLPVAGTIKVNRTTKGKNLEYTNVQNEILGLLLDNSWQLKYNYPLNIPSDGAIWTTLDDCGDIQQNVNHYYVGDDVYVNGAFFDPDTGYNWNINGAPCSCDPNIVVANGTVYTDSDGNFCFNAYTVQSDDCGVYHVNVGNKNDNYQVVTCENDPPVIYNPNPPNSATNVPVTITELSVTIEDPEGDTIDWTITTSPNIGSNSGTGETNGTKTCSISSLEYNTTYTWYVNATDPDGSSETTEETYTFTTMTNYPPVIFNPYPEDGITGVCICLSELSVTIEDPEGDLFDWSIETSPDVGSSSGTGESNGTKTCSVICLEYDTTYTWYVDATDPGGSGETTEEVYTFTTESEGNDPPVISNPYPPNGATNVPVTITELSVTIEDPEGDTFDWSIETTPDIGSSSGTGESNGTKTCSVSGLEYNTIYRLKVEATDPDGSGRTRQRCCTFTTELEPLNTPSTPKGPTNLDVGESGEYCTSTTHPDGNQVQYRFDWDAEGSHDYSDWSDLVSSGTEVCVDHIWSIRGMYVVKAQARDEFGATSDWSDGLTVIVGNHPPNAPTIDGSTSGTAGTEYEYTFNAVDPDGDDIKYFIDWDDGNTEWTEYYEFGEEAKVKHTWSTQGTYTIKVKAVDVFDAESPEGTLTVTMPRHKAYINTPFLNFLQQHLNLFPILRLLFQRLGLQ